MNSLLDKKIEAVSQKYLTEIEENKSKSSFLLIVLTPSVKKSTIPEDSIPITANVVTFDWKVSPATHLTLETGIHSKKDWRPSL